MSYIAAHRLFIYLLGLPAAVAQAGDNNHAPTFAVDAR